MQLLRQPKGSRTCGQHCVAIVSGITIDESVRRFGHKHGTKTKELIAVLCDLGFITTPKLIRLSPCQKLPHLCILKVRWAKGSHWVVYNNGIIMDPAHGLYEYSNKTIKILGGKFSSYLGITQSGLIS